MKRSRFLIVLLGLLAAPAMAALQALEQAVELRLDQVTLPGGPGSQMPVRRCADCPTMMLQVTAATTYYVSPSRTAVSLQELKDAAAGSTPRQKTFLNVFFDPETRRVTRLVLDRAP